MTETQEISGTAAKSLPPGAAPIEGYPGYFVTRCGRIFSVKKHRVRELGQNSKDRTGHRTVLLCGTKRNRRFFVHRLMAEAFLPKPDDPTHIEVRHLDDNPSNNDISNLAWGNRSLNYWDAARNGRYNILTENEVIEIRRLAATGIVSNKQIAKQFGCTYSNVYCIIKRKSWKHVE